jgi:xanthine/uracil permease
MLGVALIVIGIVIIDRSLWTLKDISLFFLAGFIATATIMLGGAVMGGFPIRTMFKALLVFGLCWFLILFPILLLPLPPEAPPLVIGSSGLLLVLIIGCYEKWKKKHETSKDKGKQRK